MMAAGKDVSKFNDRFFKKREEKLETAFQQMILIIKFVNSFAYFMGVEFIDDWKVNARTVLGACFNFTMIIDETYTIYHKYPSVDCLILIGFICFTVTVSTKLTVLSHDHKKYMSVVGYMFDVLKSNATGPRQQIFVDVITKIKYHFKINIGLIVGGISFYVAFPCYNYIFNGVLTVISPLWLPIINSSTLPGYLVNTCYNVFFASFGCSICIAISCLLLVFVDIYDGLVSLVELDFATFDKIAEEMERGKVYEFRFRNLMMELADLARLNSYMCELFDLIATIQLTMSSLVVVSGIWAFIAFDFVGGLGPSLSFYSEMLMYCYMGQLLDNTNQRIERVVCEAKWYTYEVKHQKDIFTLFFIAQNSNSIRIANMYPLNFDTGLIITQNVYSVIMFVLNMFT
uniref:Odorant receptor n=1 Tax=Bradysia odoriphaga TaxID=1564500 RepID=A0A6B9C9T0_9DIPT|nr:odorant receptor 56 [Bradysia odoriphaga]